MDCGQTIAAISSAVGPARRMIVRMSGPGAGDAVRRLAGVEPAEGGTAVQAVLQWADRAVPGWVYWFKSPHSYTGEDLAEFHLPGNALLVQSLLEELIRLGARAAEAGEFTARAYFNGRIGLSEAEGVAATISAHGEEELAAARQLLAGELAHRLRGPIDELTQTLALIEAGIDFSDEDVRFLGPEDARRRMAGVASQLRELLGGSTRFERLSHEVQFVLVGRPNAGKSTLLNALCGMERAVVSPLAGTTRDVLSAEVVLRRGIARVTDVAGIDPAAFAAEAISAAPPAGRPMEEIARQMHVQAMREVERADRVVLVRDQTDAREAIDVGRRADLEVWTKADLGLAAGSQDRRLPGALRVSALRGKGMDELRRRLDELAFGRPGGGTLALNARHRAAIDQALAALVRGDEVADRSEGEMLAFELRLALDALGRVVGQVTPDDVLGRVFATFCIGK